MWHVYQCPAIQSQKKIALYKSGTPMDIDLDRPNPAFCNTQDVFFKDLELPILISAKELAEGNDGKTGSVLQQICNFMQQQLLVTVSSVGEMLDCVDQCYLFVDGLDEVDKRQQEPLMRVLEQISLRENRISIILSTRSTETIEYHRDNWTQCSLGRLH